MDSRSRFTKNNHAYRNRHQPSRQDYSRPLLRSSVDGFLVPRTNPKPTTQTAPERVVEKAIPASNKIIYDASNFQNIQTRNTFQHHLPKQLPSQTTSRRTEIKKPKFFRFLHGRPLMPMALSSMAVLLFSIGVLVAVNTIQTNKTALAQVNDLSKGAQNNSSGEGVPSEDIPSSTPSSYNVAPDLPKILKINKINVNAKIRSLGIAKSGALKTPGNIFDVGWYDEGAKPGENGAMVLDGHVSGPTKKGVFYKLGTLKAGDKITVVSGDNQEFNYTVVDVKEYDSDKVDMPKVLTTSVAGKKGLNLITCTGKFNAQTNSFQKRVVVFTTQD